MIKYVLFGRNLFQYTDFDIIRFLFNDVMNDEDFLYVSPEVRFAEKWINFWIKKRGFRKWTSVFGVPFRNLAYKSYLKYSNKIFPNDIPVFIILKNELWYFGERGFLRYLNSKYPNCKLVYKVLNVVEYIDDKIEDLKQNYDLVILCDPKDAQKYGMPMFDLGYSYVKVEDNSTPECDCFYIGSAKNRLDTILRVYDELTAKGLKCIFFVSNVPDDQQKKLKGMYYNTTLDYDEVIKYVIHTKVVLEIVQQNQDSSTLRLLECVSYQKKLLTNNKSIKNSSYYSSENIQIIDENKNIDIEFFNSVSYSIYPNGEDVKPRTMLNKIINELNL